jgi:hypothetical protein
MNDTFYLKFRFFLLKIVSAIILIVVFYFFFKKSTFIGLKSVEEYNFNLF